MLCELVIKELTSMLDTNATKVRRVQSAGVRVQSAGVGRVLNAKVSGVFKCRGESARVES